MSNKYKRTDVSKDTIELEVIIPNKNFKESYDAIAKDKSKELDIKGFRKGQIPEDVVKKNMGDTIKFDTFQKLAPMYVNNAINEEKIEPIAPPMYKELPKMEEGKDITFTVVVTVMPEFKLGNFKKISIKKEEVKVEKKEIDESLEQIKKEQKTEEKEINDNWAKEIAKNLELEEVKNLEDLKKLIEKSLKAQKEHIALHEYQEKVLSEAIKLSKIEIPETAINFEASERERTFAYEMQERGVDIQDFMKTQGLKIEKMREMWEKDAKEALETDTLLSLYAKEKKIEVSDKELEEKIGEIKKEKGENDMYKNPQWKEYIRNIEVKQKAFKKLMEDALGKDWDKVSK